MGRRGIFTSLAFVACVALILATALAWILFENASRRDLRSRIEERLLHSAELFSRLHFQVVPSLISAAEDPAIAPFFSSEAPEGQTLLRALDRIDALKAANPAIHSIYLDNRSIGSLSTTRGWEAGAPRSDPGLRQFVDSLPPYSVARYAPRLLPGGGAMPDRVLSLVLVPPSLGGAIARTALVVNLDELEIRTLLAEPGSSLERSLVILSPQGLVLSHPDPAFFGRSAAEDPLLVEALGESESGFVQAATVDGMNLVAWTEHPVLRLRFLIVSPESSVFAEVRAARNWLLLAGLAALAVSLAVAAELARRIQARLRSQERLLAYLGEELDLGAIEPVALRPLDPSFGAYALAIARIDGFGDRARRDGPRVAARDHDALVEAAANALRGRGLALPLEPDRALLVSGARDAGKPEAAVAGAVAAMRAAGAARGALSVTAAWARPRVRFLDLPGAWAEARLAMDQAFRASPGADLHAPAAGAADSTAAKVRLPDERELERFERALAGLEGAAAADCAAAILEPFRTGGSYEEFRFAVHALWARLEGVLSAGVGSGPAESPGRTEGAVDETPFRIASVETLDEALGLFRAACREISTRGEFRHEARIRELIDRVTAYVAESIADPGLCVAKVADGVGLSAKYLRELFRRHTGEGLTEHIGRQRLEKAKRLLVETELSIKEIATRTGFVNYTYFFTYFRKTVGSTPAEFRASKEQEKL